MYIYMHVCTYAYTYERTYSHYCYGEYKRDKVMASAGDVREVARI